MDETLELDAPVSDSAGAGLAYAQRATMVSTDVDAIVSFPRSVSSGSALVVIALSQAQPVMTIADSLGHSWQHQLEITQPITGSKVDVWVVCGAQAGADTFTVSASFNNGPIHIAAYEVTGAHATTCALPEDRAWIVGDTSQPQHTVTAMITGGIVVAGFGAWFDEMQYSTTFVDDLLAVTSRPTPPAPMGDTLATVVSPRGPGLQAISILGDHPAVYIGALVVVR